MDEPWDMVSSLIFNEYGSCVRPKRQPLITNVSDESRCLRQKDDCPEGLRGYAGAWDKLSHALTVGQSGLAVECRRDVTR